MSNKYWAAEDTDTLAAEIENRFESYHQWLASSGYLKRIRTSYNTFFGVDKDGSIEIDQYDDGAVSRVSVNHFKNLLKRLHILVTQNKLTFVPRARNSDSKSQIESDYAKGLLEYYSDEKALNSIFSEAVETALICFEAFVWSPWDEMGGTELAADLESNQILNSGDQAFQVLTALDVARCTQNKDSNWHILRVRKNKYDLAAQFPQFETEILGSSLDWRNTLIELRSETQQVGDDMTDVKILYHKPSAALPKGREMWVVGGVAIKDGPLRYKKSPIFRLSAGEIIGQICGDSPASEILPLQEVLDALYSAVTTNNLNYAMQNIFSTDPNISIKQINQGQNLITGAAPPIPLQLTNSSGETYKLIDNVINQQQLLSGVNATSRGAPEASLKSGTSLAMMASQAVQYVAVLQQNYAQLASDVGSCIINNVQKFATTPQIAVIGGTSRAARVKEFQREDILNIDRVSVDLGNPVSQSTAGRYELMQSMMQYGALKSPNQILSFLKTGEIDSSLEDGYKDSLTIREENEMLKRGEKPICVITDFHPQHIQEHKEVFSDPIMREDPELMKVALAHMVEHGMLWEELFQLYPAIAEGLKMPPPPGFMQAMQQGQPQEGGPVPGPAPEPSELEKPEVNGVKLPSLPPNAPAESQQDYDQVLSQASQQSPQ
jgi:hypothetical protein